MSEQHVGATFPLDSAPAPDELTSLTIDGHEVVLANVDGQLHAVDGTCTHEECPLIKGWVDGDCIVCECHGGTFDLRTGEPVDGPVLVPVRVHSVDVHGDSFTVRLQMGTA